MWLLDEVWIDGSREALANQIAFIAKVSGTVLKEALCECILIQFNFRYIPTNCKTQVSKGARVLRERFKRIYELEAQLLFSSSLMRIEVFIY
ncbi:hypothetical protein MTO96_005965 [Rhipicephalus appendiculatus]